MSALKRVLNRFGHAAVQYGDPPEVIRVWALRALLNLKGWRQFLKNDGVSCEQLAHYLGLGRWADDLEPFDAKAMRVELQRSQRAIEADLASHATPLILSGNVQRVAAVCGLSEVDCRLLAFVILMHEHRLLSEAMESLGRVETHKLPQVLSTLLGLPVFVLEQSVSRQGALVQSGLLTINGLDNLPDKLALISDHFASRMCAEETDAVALFRDVVLPADAPELGLDDYAHIELSLAVLLPYLRHALDTKRKGANVLLYGVPGTGKTQLARILAHELGCQLFEVSSEDADGEPIGGSCRLRAYRATQSIFSQQTTLLVFDEAEDVFFDGTGDGRRRAADSSKAWMNRALENNPVPTLWISNRVEDLDPAYTRRFDIVQELPIPPRTQRERIIQRAGGDALAPAMVNRLAKSEDLAPAVITRALGVVLPIRSTLSEQRFDDALTLVVNGTLAVQGHAVMPDRHALDGLPDAYDPAFIRADVDLAQVAEGLKQRGEGRLCLYGPPGTGKTAYGRWLAEQLGKPLLVKRTSDLISMWVGGTEKNMARAFRAATEDDAVLLIDEVDSFLRDRRGAKSSWEVTGVNEMLTQMESFGGVFVASTNLMADLDQAALRRFDLKAKFGFLHAEQARALFRRYVDVLGVAAASPAVCRELSGLTKLTPGDFAAVARRHRFHPLRTADEMLAALRAECQVKESGGGRIGFV